MRIEELDFDLPSDRIATAPAEPRDSARLLVVHRSRGTDADPCVEHHHVRDLPRLLQPNDLLVVNDSAVLPAYLTAERAATGGRVTGLFLHSHPVEDASDTKTPTWHLMLESRGTLRPGERIRLDDRASLELLAREADGSWRARLTSDADTLTTLQRTGRTPLPPYIRKTRRALGLPELDEGDAQRYNTVYAHEAGSVAAPTAGLHLTRELLADLEAQGVMRAAVTLHVGMGTFAPIRVARVEDHPIHREWMSVPAATLAALNDARRRGGRIIPVGTTTVRALESLPPILPDPPRDVTMETQLFITPPPADRSASDNEQGYPFRLTDALMTNFHLPRSTLLAMVAALPGIGVERLKRYYHTAIEQNYRFYSYGDAMLIL